MRCNTCSTSFVWSATALPTASSIKSPRIPPGSTGIDSEADILMSSISMCNIRIKRRHIKQLQRDTNIYKCIQIGYKRHLFCPTFARSNISSQPLSTSSLSASMISVTPYLAAKVLRFNPPFHHLVVTTYHMLSQNISNNLKLPP